MLINPRAILLLEKSMFERQKARRRKKETLNGSTQPDEDDEDDEDPEFNEDLQKPGVFEYEKNVEEALHFVRGLRRWDVEGTSGTNTSRIRLGANVSLTLVLIASILNFYSTYRCML